MEDTALVRIVTNPGSNLAPKLVAHYGIDITPQQIVVDGEHHDTRGAIDHDTVDQWVRGAKKHPFVLGTGANEFAGLFMDLANTDREILSIQTSRHIIGSYDAAMAAKKTLSAHPRFRDLRVAVVDSKATDAGAALLTILAAEARAAGLGIDRIADLVERAADRMVMCLYVADLSYLVKGGRASFLRAFMANLLDLRPLITFVNGDLKPAAKIKTSADKGEAVCRFLAERVGDKAGRAWLAITHGSDLIEARKVSAAVKHHFNAEMTYFVPAASSIYLHVGRGAVAAFVLPLDGLPWMPASPPPAFSV